MSFNQQNKIYLTRKTSFNIRTKIINKKTDPPWFGGNTI